MAVVVMNPTDTGGGYRLTVGESAVTVPIGAHAIQTVVF